MPLPAFSRSRNDSLRSIASNNNVSSPLRPPSPTFSTTTVASGMNLNSGPDVIITRADLRKSANAYEDLVNATVTYRSALASLSQASAGLADAMERCSRLKGVSDECAVGMQAASGLYHLIANHEQVLGHSLLSSAETPLRHHLQEYKTAVADRSARYEQTLMEKSRLIRKTEMENMSIGRRKQRDLNSFRAALNILQAQVNELDNLKGDYYQQVLTHEEGIWDFVLSKVSYIVRSSLDVYDRITAKSSDVHLEPLMLAVPDPFDSYGPQKNENQIFSILPPLAILGAAGSRGPSSSSPSPLTGSPESDGKLEGRPSTSMTSSNGGLGEKPWAGLPIDEPLDHHGNRVHTTSLPPTSAGPSYYSEWADVTSPSQISSTTKRYSLPPSLPFPPGPSSRTASSSSIPSNNNSLGKTSRSPPGASKLRTELRVGDASDESDDTRTLEGTRKPPTDEHSGTNTVGFWSTTPLKPVSHSPEEIQGDTTPRLTTFPTLSPTHGSASSPGIDSGSGSDEEDQDPNSNHIGINGSHNT